MAEARLHLAHSLLEGVHLGEMHQVRQALGICLAHHEGLEDGAAAYAQDVAEETGEFQVGVLEGFLNPEGMLGDLTHELFAGAGEIAQLLDGGGRSCLG